jgi:hypothetical protein
MQNDEQLLSEALQRAVQIVETVEERYRDVAFPTILQSIIGALPVSSTTCEAESDPPEQHITEARLLPTTSVNVFFRRANPDTHPARFVTAAYYLLHAEHKEQFTTADILEIYRTLRQPQPKNPTDVMNQCIRKVHIIDAVGKDKQKYWAITPDGEKYVEELIDDNNSSTING